MVSNTGGISALNSQGTQVQRATGGASKSDFLRLLTEQLRHQDPLNPMEDSAMMAQLAQFSTLEETQAMRSALDQIASGSLVSQGAAFIGKKVEGTIPASTDAYGKAIPAVHIAGVVTGVAFREGQVYLEVGDKELPMSYTETVSTAQ